MFQRHNREVRRLHSRPHHPILLVGIPVRAPQLVARTRALHNRHASEEAGEIRGREHALIGEDFGGDLESGTLWDLYATLEEGEPEGCGGAEDGWWGAVVLVSRRGMSQKGREVGRAMRTTAIEHHSPCTLDVVVLETSLFDCMLGEGVACAEKDLLGRQPASSSSSPRACCMVLCCCL